MEQTTEEALHEPVFKSTVPSPLLDMCKNNEEGHIRRYLLESQSVQSQQIQWLIRQSMSENKALVQIEKRMNISDEKTQSLIDWKNNLSGKTAVIGALVVMVVSAVFGAVGKSLSDKFFSPHP